MSYRIYIPSDIETIAGNIIVIIITIIIIQADKKNIENTPNLNKILKEEEAIGTIKAIIDIKKAIEIIQETEVLIDTIKEVVVGERIIAQNVITVNIVITKSQIIIAIIIAIVVKGLSKTESKDQELGKN